MKRDNLINFIDKARAINEPDAPITTGYIAKPFVQVTLPHSRVNGTRYERTNGYFTLSVTSAFSNTGLPYGTIPRLLLVWITTEAVKTQSRELILGNNLSEFMNKLGLVPTGGRWGSITRLKEQANRLFSCTIAWRYKPASGPGSKGIYTIITRENEGEIYWWDTKKDPDQTNLFDSVITLHYDFYKEIIAAPIVIRLETLKAIKQSSLAVDIYTWLTYRNSYAKKPSKISWEDLQFQFGAGYPLTSQGKRNFKKKFIQALKKVELVYPEAGKLRVDNGDYLLFVPGKPDVSKLVIPT